MRVKLKNTFLKNTNFGIQVCVIQLTSKRQNGQLLICDKQQCKIVAGCRPENCNLLGNGIRRQ